MKMQSSGLSPAGKIFVRASHRLEITDDVTLSGRAKDQVGVPCNINASEERRKLNYDPDLTEGPAISWAIPACESLVMDDEGFGIALAERSPMNQFHSKYQNRSAAVFLLLLIGTCAAAQSREV